MALAAADPSRPRCATTAWALRPATRARLRAVLACRPAARATGGTGLGLSIALEDARLHGGELVGWGHKGEGASSGCCSRARPVAISAPRRCRLRPRSALSLARARVRSAVSPSPSRGRLRWRCCVLLAWLWGAHAHGGHGRSVRRSGTVQDAPEIRKLPAGPPPGASPEEHGPWFPRGCRGRRRRSWRAAVPCARRSLAGRGRVTVYEPETLSALKVSR